LGWQPTIPLNDSLLRVLTYWRQVVWRKPSLPVLPVKTVHI
jgi:hypothetical protein